MIRVLEGYDRESYYEEVNDGEVDYYEYANVVDDLHLRLYEIGNDYNGFPIVGIYNHSTSDSVWIVVGSDTIGYFEIAIDGCIQDGGMIYDLPFR